MATDKIVTINCLSGEYRSISELQRYSDKQYVALQKAAEEIKRLNDEVAHLKQLLNATVPLIRDENEVVELIVSDAQAILESQINLMKERGLVKELSFEDTKRLEILVKSLKVVKEKDGKDIPVKSRPVVPSDVIELTKIAAQLTPEELNNG